MVDGDEASGETYVSQYADMREELSSDELPAEQDAPVESGAAALHLEEEPMVIADDVSLLDGSWFRENRVTDKGKRLLDVSVETPASEIRKKPKSLSSVNHTPKRYPSNKTLLSSNLNTVVLVSQLHSDADKYVGASSRRFASDPLGISKGLKMVLDFRDVKDVRINKRRNLVAVEFKQPGSAGSAVLLAADHLGKYATKSSYPSADSSDLIWGVIGQVPLDEDLEEFAASLRGAGYNIRGVTRLHRYVAGSKQPSTSVKVGFLDSTLPSSVQFDFVKLPVRLFQEPPIRCFRCQRHGHLSSGCNAPLRCLVCGGNHEKHLCTATDPCCANCGGGHIASPGTVIWLEMHFGSTHLLKRDSLLLKLGTMF